MSQRDERRGTGTGREERFQGSNRRLLAIARRFTFRRCSSSFSTRTLSLHSSSTVSTWSPLLPEICSLSLTFFPFSSSSAHSQHQANGATQLAPIFHLLFIASQPASKPAHQEPPVCTVGPVARWIETDQRRESIEHEAESIELREGALASGRLSIPSGSVRHG